MKVWSKVLLVSDLEAACEQVNREFPGCSVFLGSSTSWGGSGDQRCELYVGKRTRRIDGVHLRSGKGTHRPNPGTSDRSGAGWTEGEMAASWTEWGWFLARVFERDPNARCGDYRSAADFHEQTQQHFIEPRTPRERQVKGLIAVA